MLDFLGDLYKRVKESHDKDLAHVLAILRPKAKTDPQIAEAISIIEAWQMEPSNPVTEIPPRTHESKQDDKSPLS